MRRRDFIKVIAGSIATWPARAQQPERVRRIGVLMAHAESDPEGQAFVAAFQAALQKLGWTEGRNIRIDTRWAAEVELMQGFAKELIALQPDLILANNTPTTAAVLQQTRTIPIIFTVVADPVGSGFVASFPRPGGNVTGFNVSKPTLAGKFVELLKEIAPHVARVAMLFNIFVKVPSHWLALPGVAGSLMVTAMQFLRNTTRVVSIKYFVSEITWDGQSIRQILHFLEGENLKNKSDSTRHWTRFDDPQFHGANV